MDSVLVYTGQDTVGDGLVKLPFLRDLRRRFPASRLSWCAGIGPCAYAGTLAPLVKGLLDEVIENPGLGRSPWQGFSPLRPLAGRRFDLVIDTQKAVLRSLAVRRIRHGMFLSAASGFRLSDRKPAPQIPRPRHLIDQLRGLLDLVLPAPSGSPLPPLVLPESLKELARALLPDGAVYVGISPGAGDKAKCWPLERFIALAKIEAESGRIPVLFLGPEEQAWMEQIREAVPEALIPESDPRAIAAGTGPLLVIALAGRLAAAVANDSGTGHMLAAGNAPLVSLFSKHDPKKYAPSADRLAIVDSKDFGGVDPALIPLEAVRDALAHLFRGGHSYRTA